MPRVTAQSLVQQQFTLWSSIWALGRFAEAVSSLLQELESHLKIARAHAEFQPKFVWAQYVNEGMELPIVALALLSVVASQAAVERTFSAQDLVHAKKRNRLHQQAVQAEMFVRFNSHAIDAVKAASHPTDLFIQLGADINSSDADTEVEVEFVRPPRLPPAVAAAAAAAPRSRKRQAVEDAESGVGDEGEAAAAAVAAPARIVRTKSAVQKEIDKWLWDYIEKNNITSEYEWEESRRMC